MMLNRLLAFLVISTGLHADQSVTLAWDPSTDPEVTGAIVYYGNASRNYPYHTNVGNVTRATVQGLKGGLKYFFAVTATNTAGLESDYSNEVSAAIPLTPLRNLVLKSGIESAPFLFGPWTEIWTTNIPITIWESNLFYRPTLAISNPPVMVPAPQPPGLPEP